MTGTHLNLCKFKENSTSSSRPDLPNRARPTVRNFIPVRTSAWPCREMVRCIWFLWAYSRDHRGVIVPGSPSPSTPQPRSKLVASYTLPDSVPKYICRCKIRNNATPFKRFLITTDPEDKDSFRVQASPSWISAVSVRKSILSAVGQEVFLHKPSSPVAVATVMPNHKSLIEHLFDLLLDMLDDSDAIRSIPSFVWPVWWWSLVNPSRNQ